MTPPGKKLFGSFECAAKECILQPLFPTRKAIAPIDVVSNLRIPALFLYGKQDESFSSQTLQLFEALKQ